MKYIITGGAGFIGSHIVEELVRQGQEVVVIDNLYNTTKDKIKRCLKKIRFVKGDVRDIELLKKEFKGADFVLHLAALISVTESVRKPEEYREVNVGGTRNVLEASKLNNVKRVVFSSSCAVYGSTGKVPQDESLEPMPMSPYAENKLEGEKLCKEYYKNHGLKTVCLRYFNVFGPRQDPKSPYAGVISIFAQKLLDNEQPTIFGDGEQTRDYVFVKNVVQANLLACKAEKGFGEVFNIGTEKEISVNTILKLVNKGFGKDIKPIFAPAREGEMSRACADCTKAKKVLGYRVNYSFEHGLTQTISWLQEKK